MVSAASCHESYSPLVLYLILSFSSDMIVVFVATESGVALEFSISIYVGVVVELTCSLESLVSFRDTSHGSVLFQIQSLSGCASSNFSTLVVGQIWCLVNLDMLDPKNTFLFLGAG